VHESARTKNKTLARDAERLRRRELEEKWNRVERRTLPPTFERAADDWFENVKQHLAERTEAIYEVALRCHLKPDSALYWCATLKQTGSPRIRRDERQKRHRRER
jgi:hypothetical protein